MTAYRLTGRNAPWSLLAALAFALCVVAFAALASGCGFPAALAKTHEGLKGMSSEVEPPLAAECLTRAKACPPRPAACEPLDECRRWKANYVSGTQLAHRGLARCNRTYHDLKKAGVIK